MNHKRKKPRRKVKCFMCTDARDGNSQKSNPPRGRNRRNQARVRDARQYDHGSEELSRALDALMGRTHE